MTNLLSIKNLSFAYGKTRVLHGVSFSVAKGRFCGLLGPNGAGKSTLFAFLAGLLPVEAGAVEVAGHDMAKNPRAALARLGIVFQQPTLELDMTVLQNMRYFASLHGLAGRAVEMRIDECLEMVAMHERRTEKVRVLNGGHRRRMEIARALIHRPDILLLDEATVGLDVASRKSIVDDAHALAAAGVGMLWATHLVDEIRPGDDAVILHKGRVMAEGRAKDLAGKGGSLLETFLAFTGGGDDAAGSAAGSAAGMAASGEGA